MGRPHQHRLPDHPVAGRPGLGRRLAGVGLGASRAKWGFLPYAHTDFIFAIIGEELGLVGAVVVVGLFVLLGVLGIRIACTPPTGSACCWPSGVTAWFLVQAFVNIGAVVGVLPITGVPLPFVCLGRLVARLHHGGGRACCCPWRPGPGSIRLPPPPAAARRLATVDGGSR